MTTNRTPARTEKIVSEMVLRSRNIRREDLQYVVTAKAQNPNTKVYMPGPARSRICSISYGTRHRERSYVPDPGRCEVPE
jgi:hypothetical protein